MLIVTCFHSLDTKDTLSQWLRLGFWKDALTGHGFESAWDWFGFSFTKLHIFSIISYFLFIFNIYMPF